MLLAQGSRQVVATVALMDFGASLAGLKLLQQIVTHDSGCLPRYIKQRPGGPYGQR
jgi:hypothetical protein